MVQLEQIYKSAIRSMNYLFLKDIKNNIELHGVIKEEVRLFLVALSNTLPDVSKVFEEVIKTEMDEGGYTEEVTFHEFNTLLKSRIEYIMDGLDSNVLNFYSYIAEELIQNKENK